MLASTLYRADRRPGPTRGFHGSVVACSKTQSGMVDVSVAALEDVEDILGRVDPVVDERPEDDAAIAMDGRLHHSADRPLMTEEA